MKRRQRKNTAFSLNHFFETKMWYALLAVPVLFIFGKCIMIPVLGFQYEITLSEIVIALMTIAYLVYLLSSPRKFAKINITPIGYTLIALFILNVLSVLWVNNLDKWIIAIRVLLYQYAIFFLVINFFKTKRQCITALSALVIPAIVGGVFVLYIILGIPYGDLLYMNRAFLVTPLGAMSAVVAMIALTIPVTLGLFAIATQRWKRITMAVVYIFLVVAVLFAASKAAIIAIACAIACMTLLIRKHFLGIIALTLSAIVLYAGITYLPTKIFPGTTILVAIRSAEGLLTDQVAPATGVSLVANRFTHVLSDASTRFRILELQTAWQIFLESPLIGQGAGNLKVAYDDHTGFYDGEANNIFVQYTAEFGLVGLALFGYLLYQLSFLYRNGYFSRRKKNLIMWATLSGVLLTVAINSMFEVTIIGLIYGILFWYVIGIFVAYSRVRS
ncbi:MAG: O-antigen ligase family protein [bacterium]|nr:O-antigen ligase family protein [bacterium]